MANRTNAADVKQLYNDSTLEDSYVDQFIDTANRIVTDILGDADLSDNVLEDIEKWLTCHLMSKARQDTVLEEKIGDVSTKFAGLFGDGLKATQWGQMVLLLDTTGKLGNLGKKAIMIKAIKSFDE